MSQSSPTFSVSQFTTWHQSHEQDVDLYKQLEVGGIEICERKLSLDSGKAREQLAMVKDSGLCVTSVQPRVHALFKDFMCPDLEDSDERMDRFCQSIDLFSDCFPSQDLPLVSISGAAPDLNFQAAHATARRIYPPLADYAADRGLRIMYEPLSPVLMNTDTITCNLWEAVQLVEDVNRPNFGLMLDIWHIWREPQIHERIASLGSMIFGVHISDWPDGEPRHPGDRRNCGDGIIDLPHMCGAIEKSGYRGAYCLEIFSVDELPDSLWQADPAQIIQRGRRGFECAWEARQCD